MFLIQGDTPQLMNWNEYGLRIHVSCDSLSSTDTAEVAVVALIGGQFIFPVNTKLVSAIYAISVSKPLLKPLRLDIQHCVHISRSCQSKYLQFAIAPVHNRGGGLPYKFSLVEGGEFSVGNRYGSIDRKSFSLVSVLMITNEENEGNERKYNNVMISDWYYILLDEEGVNGTTEEGGSTTSEEEGEGGEDSSSTSDSSDSNVNNKPDTLSHSKKQGND